MNDQATFWDADEESRIIELIEANTWPERWTGEEPLGSVPMDEVKRDGKVQPVMKALFEDAV